MLKKITLATMLIFVTITNAKHLWYENETNTDNIQYDRSSSGIFSSNNENPQTNGINTNNKISKFIRSANVTKGFTYFQLIQPIKKAVDFTVSIKAYIDSPTEDLVSVPDRLRMYFKNTTNGELFYKQLTFSIGQEWQNFTFNINSDNFTQEGLEYGGYNELYIEYGNGQSSTVGITYYIDSILWYNRTI